MGLRCCLFSSDEISAEKIGQILSGLEIEVEACPEAVAAAGKIAHGSFQIVIIDWDKQPEAELLLSTARDRKAAERPLTLAIVSDDSSVPKALQAGANSILRRPLSIAQIKDTLATARDLVRARHETPAAALSARAAAATAVPAPLPQMEAKTENTLRAGEFLQSPPATPGGSFVTESDVPPSLEQSADIPVDALKDLEPVAARVVKAPPPPADEGHGLEWYLKKRGVVRPSAPAPAPPAAPSGGKPELLSYDQTRSAAEPRASASSQSADHEQKKEAELFAYIEGNRPEDKIPARTFRLGKGAIFTALLLASIAVTAAPQAPWHPKLLTFWSRGQRALHSWLNPQPVTTPQAPISHETFARAGDEYKLPTAEPIPDATTDPSQIQVLPAVDPTAKKPNNDTATPDAGQPQPDPSVSPADSSQAGSVEVKESQPPQTSAAEPAVVAPAVPSAASSTPTVNTSVHADTIAPAASSPAHEPAPKAQPPSRQPTMPGYIPPSLRSQLAPNTPEPGGLKRPDAAMPSIEPVAVPENVERPLLIEQPPIHYPGFAKGQQGIVVLQVLIGRDGTVQDAKFLQGSLVFAKAAIDGVRQWKFKPYSMNGRPVSVQTTLSVTFKPGS